MKRGLVVLLLMVLGGCATSYRPNAVLSGGGYTEERIAPDAYRLRFSGNGYATRTTAQTYWLYRAAELAVQNGYDGFEVLTPMLLGRSDAPVAIRPVALIFIPMPSNSPPHPVVEGDIRLVRGPVAANPPKRFDARALMAALDPYVKGTRKCARDNVCEHVKDYLEPPSDGPKASAT